MISVYTDGACKGNPGPGGWGYVVLGPDGPSPDCGGVADTTNNRMEMSAVIQALRHFPDVDRKDISLKIHSDSQYVIKGITEWIFGWSRRGWVTADKQPVKNRDLWLELDGLVRQYAKIEWVWVKGHAGDRWNEEADRLACKGRDKAAAHPHQPA